MKGVQNASISAQAEQLKKSLERREKRRNEDRAYRTEEAQLQGNADIYEERSHKRFNNNNGAVAALAAISAASAYQGQVPTINCDVCKATFSSEALYKQHVAGPVHRKAIEKQQADLVRIQHMSVYQDAAQAALGAAAWTSTHGGGATNSSGLAPAKRTSVQAIRGGSQKASISQPKIPMRQGAETQATQVTKKEAMPSHAELVAMARADEGPLSIGGWIPPSVAKLPQVAATGRVVASAASVTMKTDESAVVDLRGVSKSFTDGTITNERDAGDPDGGLLGLNYGDSSESENSDEEDKDDAEADDDDPAPISFF
ncbi:hypothetical protein CEUSTIGMA_g2149.t1 [Chlamydomonas eustigma]|uniref:C2H2-type domain-containing protein n=1 Tax=Chlamydomonas eustigma TaxID=1157962 RepID=A0A250WV59_9CHLO|nr:hypothetical protein CEUSTIGMA_g2149.t1 [Chlamydomonas eustigma]|eukprot:GAX74701.1 hypothetical protein CEUSTIGMA_g2149.t1 [Chlamydomonas eustigma]